VLADAFFNAQAAGIAQLATTHRLPMMAQYREFVEAGGLLAYGPNLPQIAKRAATYVDKILKGTKAGDLPVEQPMQFELVMNLKAAKALSLTIPPALLFQATEVMQ
jgi:putative ABC transport system substrate-binding protein